MKILGIETSCDETAAAVVTEEGNILANIVHSQHAAHLAYGGVVPEIAARAHLRKLNSVLLQARMDARIAWEELDAVAVTGGPGLIGGVIVGVMAAKAMASALRKPFIAVNHLEGHALTIRLSDHIEFPYLLLLISGGHCQFLEVAGVGQYRLLGETLDDALGEAFDKVAKMLGLGYPGGPQVERLAARGHLRRFELPLSLKGREGCDFSFSGIKTAVRRLLQSQEEWSAQDKADLCASFQWTIAQILRDRIANAIALFKRHHPSAQAFVIAGGVAANRYLREMLMEITTAQGMSLYAPPPELCTDNAAMIAWAGVERFRLGLTDFLNFEPRPRWPLTELIPPVG